MPTGSDAPLRQDDFEGRSWHDDHIHGLRVEVEELARSELILDLDHIVEWVCDGDGACTFRVAPATLTFHDVTGLRLSVDSTDPDFRVAVHPLSIAAIHRASVEKQFVCLDRPYYRWRVELSWPAGEIVFGATGFTQRLRAAPILTDLQYLPPRLRPPLH